MKRGNEMEKEYKKTDYSIWDAIGSVASLIGACLRVAFWAGFVGLIIWFVLQFF